MILETIAAAAIYSSSIAYLASDVPIRAMAPKDGSSIEMKAPYTQLNLYARTGLRSFTTDMKGRIQYVNQSLHKHKSIWAKDDDEFEAWAK